jgi:predicted RNA-binding Zn ribbon-like protein
MVAEICALFQHLASEDRLPERDAETLLHVVERNLTVTTNVAVTDGRGVFECAAVATTPYAEAAYALLWLSSQNSVGIKVVECKYCRKLFLSDQQGRRRRRKFCPLPAGCGNAHAQAAYRRRLVANRSGAQKRNQSGLRKLLLSRSR